MSSGKAKRERRARHRRALLDKQLSVEGIYVDVGGVNCWMPVLVAERDGHFEATGDGRKAWIPNDGLIPETWKREADGGMCVRWVKGKDLAI